MAWALCKQTGNMIRDSSGQIYWCGGTHTVHLTYNQLSCKKTSHIIVANEQFGHGRNDKSVEFTALCYCWLTCVDDNSDVTSSANPHSLR